MDEAFSCPFMYWVGMDTPTGADPGSLTKFNEFYSKVHLPEVMGANPGFVRASRYELLTPDPRGDFGPRWLAIYEMADEAAAQAYVERNDGPPEGRPTYTQGPSVWQAAQSRWRMIWRYLSSSGTTGQAPFSIFLVGMNVPPDTNEAGLAEFNDFYTQIHVPEVIAARGYARGTRFELHREFKHPEPGCPRFCAVYEDTKDGGRPAQAAGSDPVPSPFSSGPPTWEKHDTLWRLVYRRIDLT